jgi:hypothetical protein
MKLLKNGIPNRFGITPKPLVRVRILLPLPLDDLGHFFYFIEILKCEA